MRLKNYLIPLAYLFFSAAATAQGTYSDVKISVSREQLTRLQEAGFEADHGRYNDDDGTFSTTVSKDDITKLERAGLKFTVLVADVTKDFLERNDVKDFFRYEPSRQAAVIKGNTPNATSRLLLQSPKQAISGSIVTPAAFNQGSMGGYLTLAQIKLELDSMVMAYPGQTRLDTIGYTYNNRPIWALRITNNSLTRGKGQVLLTGVHHAREAVTASAVIFYMQYLLQNYSTNARIAEIVDNREIYFIPCMNPDGYEYNRQTNPSGGGMHRKNRCPVGATSTSNVGIDINRNYSYGWGYNNTGSSPTPSSDTYRGVSATSEKEIQAIRDLMRANRFLTSINYHCYGGYAVTSPCVDTIAVTAVEEADIAYFGDVNTTYNGYKRGTPMQTLGYTTNGGAQDFFFRGDAAYRPTCANATVEFNCGTFWPSASQIIPICKETVWGSIQTTLMGGGYAKVEDRNPLSLQLAADSFRFTAQRLGKLDSAVTISIIPIENIDTVGGPVTIQSMPLWRSEANGAIRYVLPAGLASSTRIRYVWKVVCGGITVLDTVTRYYKPSTLFTDNMESGAVTTKWTVSGGWNYTSTAAYDGSRSLTESPSGNYGNSSTLDLTCKTVLNLSNATDASLSYWVRYGAENGGDKLQVKFSTNGIGSSATFTPFAGQRTIAENVGTIGGQPSYTGIQNTWVRETISLKSLLGQTNVGLRFTFSSNASVVLDGFYIDNVEVAKINGSPVLQKLSQLLSGVTENNRNILAWRNDDDEQIAGVVVQRSANGSEFTDLDAVAKTTGFVDEHPADINYYRLQITDRKADVYYSNTIILENSRLQQVLVNNPVAGELRINAGVLNEPGSISIYTMGGSRVIQQPLTSTGTHITIPMKDIAAGNYLMVITNPAGKVLARQTFVKQ